MPTGNFPIRGRRWDKLIPTGIQMVGNIFPSGLTGWGWFLWPPSPSPANPPRQAEALEAHLRPKSCGVYICASKLLTLIPHSPTLSVPGSSRRSSTAQRTCALSATQQLASTTHPCWRQTPPQVAPWICPRPAAACSSGRRPPAGKLSMHGCLGACDDTCKRRDPLPP